MKLFTAMILSVISTSALAQDSYMVIAIPRNSSCITNNQCIVASAHSASIYNSSTSAQIFFVAYKICPQNEDCRTDTYKLNVGPGTWSDNKMMTTSAKYHYKGDFALWAETTVFNAARVPLKTVRNQGVIQVHD